MQHVPDLDETAKIFYLLHGVPVIAIAELLPSGHGFVLTETESEECFFQFKQFPLLYLGAKFLISLEVRVRHVLDDVLFVQGHG